jgi:hypothetical protein
MYVSCELHSQGKRRYTWNWKPRGPRPLTDTRNRTLAIQSVAVPTDPSRPYAADVQDCRHVSSLPHSPILGVTVTQQAEALLSEQKLASSFCVNIWYLLQVNSIALAVAFSFQQISKALKLLFMSKNILSLLPYRIGLSTSGNSICLCFLMDAVSVAEFT